MAILGYNQDKIVYKIVSKYVKNTDYSTIDYVKITDYLISNNS